MNADQLAVILHTALKAVATKLVKDYEEGLQSSMGLRSSMIDIHDLSEALLAVANEIPAPLIPSVDLPSE